MEKNTKFLLLVSIVLFAIILFPSITFATAEGAKYEELTYEISSYTHEITIIGCEEEATDVVIPEMIGKYKVTGIDMDAFYEHKNLVSIKIPSTVTYIDWQAFARCSNLKSVEILEGITYISGDMFYGCENLTEVKIPSSVTEIGMSAFSGCSKLETLNIPLGVTKIETYAFTDCSSLSNINLPPNLKELGSNVFENCTSLKEIQIPMTMTELNSGTFLRCTSLRKIILPHTIEYFGNSIFDYVPKDATFYVVEDSEGYLYVINNGFTPTCYTIPITDCYVTGISDKVYTGYDITQNLEIKYGGYTLKSGKDYLTYYSENRNVGEATITIEGKYAFIGTMTKKFNITPKDLLTCNIGNVDTQTYTGKNIEPGIIIRDGNLVLEEGRDYITEYKNNKIPGKATESITAIGNYIGSIERTFNIEVKKVTNLKVKKQDTSTIQLNWSKSPAVTGYELYKYNSSKKKWEKVTTTSKTSYTVKKLKSGTSYKFRVRAYVSINNKKYYSSYSSTLSTATKTKTPKISKITSKSQKATISWKKVSGASGYQIYMATSKKGKYSKVKTITSGKTVKYTKGSLKKKKTYYFKIRTYKTVSGKKIYSSYSSVKSIKVK